MVSKTFPTRTIVSRHYSSSQLGQGSPNVIFIDTDCSAAGVAFKYLNFLSGGERKRPKPPMKRYYRKNYPKKPSG